jgi:hypothetical protein
MKTWESGGIAALFLTSVLNGGEWSASRPGRFTHKEITSSMALGSTEPLTEMSTRNLPEVEGRPARKADNLTTICEPIV